MDLVIEARKLTKQFGRVRAVDELDLEVRRGDVYGFLGPNGAGKSTTIRMIVGLIKPAGGVVRVFGRDISKDPGALSNVGALVETPSFYKYLTGRQNLEVFSRANAKKAEINAVLEEVKLSDRADDKVKAYSQGMRQRLGLALAMLGNPELVILDEPTNGLDPKGMKEIRQIIRELAAKRGVTIFLSSHLLHEVEQTCDRIGIVSKGRLVTQRLVKELTDLDGDVSVRVDRPEAALQSLRNLDYIDEVTSVDGTLRVRIADQYMADLNACLVNSGFKVSELVRHKHSLEDIYLSIVEDAG